MRIIRRLVRISAGGLRDLAEYDHLFLGPGTNGVVTNGVLPPDAAQVYFKKAYPRLQAIKKKYDPEVVFNKWYPIQPAA